MTLEVPSGFDPYRVWLGVNEPHRPLTAYQLLGLSAGEADVDAIRSAAGLKRAAMQSHRAEAPPAIWEQVHQEMEEAIATLLDSDRKTAYDMAMRMEERPSRHPFVPSEDVAHGAVLLCARCGTSNPATRGFCVNCGAGLWEPCLQCGTLSTVGEKFCGACGVNLAATVEEHLNRFAISTIALDQMRRESRFDEAIDLAKTLTAIEHPRLKEHRATVALLIQQLTAEREMCRLVADQAYKDVEGRLAEGDYSGAAQILEGVPAPMRTPPMEKLLNEARSRAEEIEQLNCQLQQAADSKVEIVMAAVARLLSLQPNHARAQRLADHLRERVGKAAKVQLAAHRYDKAFTLLQHFPSELQSPAIAGLYEQISELAWMAREVRTAPAVTPVLLAIAARFQRAVVDDQAVAKLVTELNRRAQLLTGSPPQVAIPWASPAKGHEPAFRVDWRTGWRGLAEQDGLDSSVLRDNPGRFFVAAGLALQGLGQAPISINLMPSDRRGWREHVGRLMRVRLDRSTPPAWGVDVGSSALKAVKLQPDAHQGRALVTAVKLLEYRKPLSQALNEEEKDFIIAETLKEFATHVNLKTDRICVGIPSSWAVIRQWTAPASSDAKLDALVRHEAKHMLPLALDQLVWDYQKFGASTPPAATSNGSKNAVAASSDILLVAVKKALATQFVERLQQAGLRADMIQTDGLALYNFLAFESFVNDQSATTDPDEPQKAIAILDVGDDSSYVLVASSRCLWIRSSGLGGRAMNTALVRDFQLTFAASEQWKREPTAAVSLHHFHKSIEPIFADLAKQLGQSLALFGKSRPQVLIERVWLVGGGACVHGLLGHLRRADIS